MKKKPPSQRPERRREPDGPGRTLRFFTTCVDETDEELVAQIRACMADQRRNPGETVLAVHGFDDDPRDLGEIPEAVRHLARLVEFGAIAVLTRSAGCRELGAPDWMIGVPVLGAFEVWMISQGHYKAAGPVSFPETLLRHFREQVFPAAERALARNLERYTHVPAGGPETRLDVAVPPEHKLNPLVEVCQDLLEAAWSLHRSDGDILLLADLARPEAPDLMDNFWPAFHRKPPTRTVEGRLMSAALQPLEFLDLLAKGADWTRQQTVRELRGFSDLRKGGMDIVPLLVILPGGTWATMWAPPGSNVVPFRHEPIPEPDRN